ncbi:LysE family translocator [Bacillus haynesii]|uniref:LysE family translocator n=1 Tax=Bacillus haynesii TaxID=1925021 RepID=UPI0022826463|nr:LysE family transporter [Bacillus haynesii]MCY7817591.1 LysE family transporter [Bacillus haynesii]MCY8224972.1 LysE family transporter [Bacillus haynesii]MCY8243272.1 LysE family transporter [Bacillus haynesii]MCY8372766.1 LysE family transporter [Bacillus haynesii]MCY8569866.1 LysE family transporter [Bacillus haynesii]
MSTIAFLSYVIMTSITPGPSNILMMNEAQRFGFIGSWRFNSGILAGFSVLGILSGIFTISLYNWIPVVEPYFKLAGACYLIYLAWQIGLPKNKKQNAAEARSSFVSGFIFQLINVKSILFFLTVMSAFILPFHHSMKWIIFYLALAIVLGWLALLLWSGFGSVFKKLFAKHDRVFRVVMCLLLVYSAVSIFL